MNLISQETIIENYISVCSKFLRVTVLCYKL